MLDSTESLGRGRRILRLVGFIALAIGLVVAVRDGAFGWFVGLALVGGALSALLLIALHRKPGRTSDMTVPDTFGREWPARDLINISRQRVAGVGGLALIAVAVMMAIELPRIGISLALGLVGGFFTSLALISYRKRHTGQWP